MSAPSSPDDVFKTKFEAAKLKCFSQVLMRCGRLLNEYAVGRLNHELSGFELRPAHTNLFPHIELEGSRLTDIAQKLGISKQAVSQLVSDLEGAGMLERVPDPRDGRAKLVRFTNNKGATLMDGMQVLFKVDKELIQSIGKEEMAQFHQTLLKLQGELERRRDEEE